MNESTVLNQSALATGGSALQRPKPSFWRRAGTLARQQPLGVIGLLLVLIVIILALFAGVIARYGPEELSGIPLTGPNSTYWFGTDDFGRDVFSRVIYGGRISLLVGFLSALAGGATGTAIGLISAYEGGWLDLTLQRLVDALMAFPSFILALAVVAGLGTSERNVIIAISITMIPINARIARGSTLALRNAQFVDAAQTIGSSGRRIMFRHILPNILGPLTVVITASFGWAVVSEAALSFIGLGTPPPAPSWGNMMSGSARTYISAAPWMALFPGIALSMLVFGVNMLGDALRDILDPRLRAR
jgi:peptide/nickel transport system permease protein